MNAEIISVLEQFYPPEPSVEEVLERVHSAIALSKEAWALPYRKTLVDALDELSDTLSKGLEYDQLPLRAAPSPWKPFVSDHKARMQRWRRAAKYGVEQQDLESEISKGFLRQGHRDTIKLALEHFREGNPHKALRQLKLEDIKFAEPEKAHKAIEADLREYFTEKWGSPEAAWDIDGDDQ
jgi:hypothetical protein